MALDMLTLNASTGMPLGQLFRLSEYPDDREWTDIAESDAKKPFGGTAYRTSQNALSKPFFGGLSYGLRS